MPFLGAAVLITSAVQESVPIVKVRLSAVSWRYRSAASIAVAARELVMPWQAGSTSLTGRQKLCRLTVTFVAVMSIGPR